MDNAEKIAGLVLAIAAILSPIVTLALGWMQAKNQKNKDEMQERLDEKRGKVDDLLDFSNAAKNMGETWEDTVNWLRSEITRIKQSADEREAKLLADLKVLREQLQSTQARLDAVMESDMAKAKELEKRLVEVTTESDHRRAQVVDLQTSNLRLQTEVTNLQDQNTNLHEELASIQRQVNDVQKKVTGQLPSSPSRGEA